MKMVQYIKQHQEDNFRIDLHETRLKGCILFFFFFEFFFLFIYYVFKMM